MLLENIGSKTNRDDHSMFIDQWTREREEMIDRNGIVTHKDAEENLFYISMEDWY